MFKEMFTCRIFQVERNNADLHCSHLRDKPLVQILPQINSYKIRNSSATKSPQLVQILQRISVRIFSVNVP